ncbi:hypothetical protein BH09GEM1_BH09GEM1_13260 [soil metagenome]
MLFPNEVVPMTDKTDDQKKQDEKAAPRSDAMPASDAQKLSNKELENIAGGAAPREELKK